MTWFLWEERVNTWKVPHFILQKRHPQEAEKGVSKSHDIVMMTIVESLSIFLRALLVQYLLKRSRGLD